MCRRVAAPVQETAICHPGAVGRGATKSADGSPATTETSSSPDRTTYRAPAALLLRDVPPRAFIGFQFQNGLRSSVEFLSCEFCPCHAAAWPASVLWLVRAWLVSGAGGRIVHSCRPRLDTPCMFAIFVRPWAKLRPKAPTTLFVSSSYSLQMISPLPSAAN